jgi:hypothetical protein
LLRRERSRVVLAASVGGAALTAVLLLQPTVTSGAGLLAAPDTQSKALTFVSAPRISAQTFAQILQRGNGGGPSPAAPHAEELYNIIVGYGLDPAVALAFFAHESQFCTTGVCASQDTKSWGANRRGYNRKHVATLVYVPSGSFARYSSFQDGVRDWCELILNGYVKKGFDTVDEAIPIYAPAADNNVPEAYINTVYKMVASWQGRSTLAVRQQPARVYTEDLTTSLLQESFSTIDASYQSGWAFHQYMIAETQAGRPLGSPLSESSRIMIGDKSYVVQTFALDTLYTPLADDENQTNWSDVRRLSDLIKQMPKGKDDKVTR